MGNLFSEHSLNTASNRLSTDSTRLSFLPVPHLILLLLKFKNYITELLVFFKQKNKGDYQVL